MEGQAQNILIVDDVAESARLISDALHAEGYQIQISQDSRKALEIIRNSPVDLILLDIVMPGMDGIQLCRILKTHEQTRSIPIILVTSVHQAREKVRGLEAGAEDLIAKPFSPLELQARVRSVLRVHRLQKQMLDSNEKLSQALQQLQAAQAVQVQAEKLGAIQATAASLNHEINNPLCSISLDLQYLQLTLGKDSPQIQERLLRMEKNIQRIHAATKRLEEVQEAHQQEFLPGQRMLDLD